MALTSLIEDIEERRAMNNAAVVSEYRCPQANAKRIASTELPQDGLLSPSEAAQIRLFLEQAAKESEERLSREKTLVFELDKRVENTVAASIVGFVIKREVARKLGVFECDLLDLDVLYEGMFVRASHLIISEAKVPNELHRMLPHLQSWPTQSERFEFDGGQRFLVHLRD